MDSTMIGSGERIRICLISMQRVFEVIGGIEAFTKRLCRSLDGYGVESYVVCRSIEKLAPKVQADCCDDFEKREPESYRRLPKGSVYVYLVSLIAFSILLFLKLLSEIRKNRLDILHAQDPFFAGLPAVLAGRLTNRPTIVHCHGSHSLPNLDRPKNISWMVHRVFFVLTVKIGKEFFVTDLATASELITEGVEPSRCTLIHTFVDERYFSCFVRSRTRTDSQFTVGYVGRLANVKRVDLLIEAIRLLRGHDIDVKGIIVGTGELMDYLIQQVSRAGIEQDVDFLGAMADVSTLLPMIDVFVLPSESEGCPLALLEAMAAGVPSVVSNIPSIRGMFTNNEVRFFRVGDAHHLASVIEEVLQDEKLRHHLSLNARKRAAAFSAKNVVNEMLVHYRRILQVYAHRPRSYSML